jgi:multicomponent Na+:H+ antiporter subunit D
MLELPPAVLFFAGALLVAVVGRRAGSVLLVGVPVAALAYVVALEQGTTLAYGFFGFELTPLRVDRLSLAFGYIFCIAAIMAGTYGLRTMDTRERVSAMLYAGSALGVVFAGDLLTLFVFWEIKAVGSTFLIWARGTPESGAAGLRYLYVQVAGGTILLAGAVLHYVETGSLAFVAFDPSVAAGLVLTGFVLSAALPPLGAWLPDAYPQASVAGTVFLSAYTTKAAVYALARGFAGYEILVWAGVAMALWGVVYAVLENDIRRLLGYHIISQVGFMVAAVGIGTEFAINGATAHAFAHILYKGLLLMGAGAVVYATGKSLGTELGGLARKMRPVLVLYMVGAVSISSFPLFSGFVTKELAVYAATADGRGIVVFLLAVASVGTFLSTGLKLPYTTWFGPDRGLRPAPIPPSMYVAMGLTAAINFGMGVAPSFLYDVLPFTVEYDPYTLDKVVQKSQILLFTGLGFWLLHEKLGAQPKVSLDTDWFYRVLPVRVAEQVGRLRRGRSRPAPAGAPAAAASGWAERIPLLRRAPVLGDAESPVYPTWVLGASIMGAFVLVLALSLVV